MRESLNNLRPSWAPPPDQDPKFRIMVTEALKKHRCVYVYIDIHIHIHIYAWVYTDIHTYMIAMRDHYENELTLPVASAGEKCPH